jgi:hypothetical protein
VNLQYLQCQTHLVPTFSSWPWSQMMEDLSASLDGVIAPPITAPLLAAPWTPPLLVFAPTGKPPLPPSPGIPPVCSCSMFKTSASVSSAVNAQGDACRDATPAFDSEEGISFSGAWNAAGTGASSTSASSGSMRANAEVGGGRGCLKACARGVSRGAEEQHLGN